MKIDSPHKGRPHRRSPSVHELTSTPKQLQKVVHLHDAFTLEEPADEDGCSAEELFQGKTGYTYDDIIMLPRHIDFSAYDVSLKCRLTRNITLHTPLVSSPMDTVTEARMAIAMALQGGIGFIHYNLPAAEQAAQAAQVKRYKNGFILEPIVLSPDNTIEDVDVVKNQFGFSGIPITENGKMNSKLVGIVTNRDTDWVSDRKQPLREVMTTELRVGHQVRVCVCVSELVSGCILSVFCIYIHTHIHNMHPRRTTALRRPTPS